MINDIYFARLCFEDKQYDKAKEIFLNNDMLYEAGFSSLLAGNIKSAKLIWKEIKNPCSATEWGFIILDLIENKPHIRLPGYFQTRAFFELYLGLFIENGHFDWAEEIINSYKFFTRANSETPKFIARTLSVFGYHELIHEFSALAKRICYYDPEIHYIEAESYLMEEKYKDAHKAVLELIKISPDYFPAKKMKNMIENSGFKF